MVEGGGGDSSAVAKLLNARGITATVEGSIRNGLTREELAGLGNLAKCGETSVISAGTSCRDELDCDDCVWVLLA